MAFMGGLAGLGATPGGFVDMTRKLTEEDQRQQELGLGDQRMLLNEQQLARGSHGLGQLGVEDEGTAALGRALQAAGMSPAALTGAGGPGPGMPDGAMAPSPGAPSGPAQVGPSAGTPPGSPIGDRFGQWDQTTTPSGALPATRPSAAPGGGPPLAPGGSPPGPTPPGTGSGGAPGLMSGGGFDLRTVTSKILESNPGIKPQVLMSALEKAAPLLNQQAKMELAQARIELQQRGLDVRQQIAADNNTSRADIAAGNNASREGIAGGNNQTRRDLAGGATKAFSSFMEANPNATPDEQAAYIRSLKPAAAETATSIKNRELANKYDVATDQIDDALNLIKSAYKNGTHVTGAGGAAYRLKEIGSNYAGWSDKTAANNFETIISQLKLSTPGLLTSGGGKTSKDERARIDKIVRGLGAGDTSQISVSDLQYLQKSLKSLRPVTVAPRAVAPAGGGGADDARAKAKAQGYTDEQIDQFLKNRK